MSLWFELVIAGCGVALAGVVALKLAGDPDRKRARRLLAAAPWRDGEPRDGAVIKVSGVVRVIEHGERFMSPLSDTRCVVYRTRVRVAGIRGLPFDLHEAIRARAFVVDTADGRVVVDSEHVLFDLPSTKLPRFGYSGKVKLLQELGLYGASASSSVFEELCVEIGSTITVAGTLALTTGGVATDERGYRDNASPGVRLVGDHEHPIVIGPG